MSTYKINIVSLGCYKNLVDSEQLMYQLEKNNIEFVFEADRINYNAVIINTCGFIEDAREESVNTILEFVELKKAKQIDKVIVMGCLSERYREAIREEIPELDGVYGVKELPLILTTFGFDMDQQDTGRKVSTPNHYAYLKISEGCNNSCSYCAIPSIRGGLSSRSMEALVKEAEELARIGVRELILIAQDLTAYGTDLYGQKKIVDLVNRLSEIETIRWIRLQYAYPSGFPEALLSVIKNNPKVCKYLDISFQHVSSAVLKSMNRRFTKEDTYAFIDKVRKEIPGLVLRSSFIVGYPTETEADYNELKTFIMSYNLDRVGVFTYSQEEGTTAYALGDCVPEEVKKARAGELMAIQQVVSHELNLNKVGEVVDVIIDRLEDSYYIGRTEFDSPEVDNEVIIEPGDSQLVIGEIYPTRITSAGEFELYGEVI